MYLHTLPGASPAHLRPNSGPSPGQPRHTFDTPSIHLRYTLVQGAKVYRRCRAGVAGSYRRWPGLAPGLARRGYGEGPEPGGAGAANVIVDIILHGGGEAAGHAGFLSF